MQLRAHLFIWVVSATVIPLLVLGLGATYLGERAHREETSQNIFNQLNNLTAEVDRHMDAERAMVRGLARVPVVREYLPVLAAADGHRRHPEFEERGDELATFLEAFQGTLPTGYTIRILDHEANTLVKVRDGERSRARYSGRGGPPLVERMVLDPWFPARLNNLEPGQAHHLLLPQSQRRQDMAVEPPLLDTVVPLSHEGRIVGHLAVSPGGRGVERIFDFNTALPEGRLLVAEIHPDVPERNGMVLYDAHGEQRFTHWRARLLTLEDEGLDALREAVLHRPHGRVPDDPDFHFVEYYPYRDQLASWVVALRAEPEVFSEPFERIRYAIWLFIGIALLLALAIIPVASRVIARPVCRMARRLKDYADGEHAARITPGGPREIRELGNAFNYMADTLDAAREERDRAQDKALQSARLASIGEMAAGIGHEINSPLNNILSLSKLMERELDEPERLRGDIAALREEAMRASETVRGILNFARQVPPAFTEFDVRTWIEESARLVGDSARAAEVGIAIHCPGGIRVRGDQHLLQQALSNLILNAVQASPPGGVVTVSAGTDDEGLFVTVTDQGAGIDEEHLERVFEPFHTTKPVGEGSGLGLSVTLGIVEHHGGRLAIGNNREGGVSATVRLPLSREETASDE